MKKIAKGWYESGVPGLHVKHLGGRFAAWYVVHVGSGLRVTDYHYGVFKTRREALAAAERLGQMAVDWSREEPPELKDLVAECREAWTGLTAAEREERARVAREAKEAEAEYLRSGGWQREETERIVAELGHEAPVWQQYGARSWRVTCRACGKTARMPYEPVGWKGRYQDAYGELVEGRCRPGARTPRVAPATPLSGTGPRLEVASPESSK